MRVRPSGFSGTPARLTTVMAGVIFGITAYMLWQSAVALGIDEQRKDSNALRLLSTFRMALVPVGARCSAVPGCRPLYLGSRLEWAAPAGVVADWATRRHMLAYTLSRAAEGASTEVLS